MCAPSLGTANKNSNRTFRSSSGFSPDVSSRGFPLSSYGYLSAQICTYIRTRDASQLLKNGRHRSRYLCIDIPQGERERSFFSRNEACFDLFRFFRCAEEPDAPTYRRVSARTAKEIATTIRTYLSPPFFVRLASSLSKSNSDSRADLPRRPVRTLNFSRLVHPLFASRRSRTRDALVPRYM